MILQLSHHLCSSSSATSFQFQALIDQKITRVQFSTYQRAQADCFVLIEFFHMISAQFLSILYLTLILRYGVSFLKNVLVNEKLR